MAAAAVTRLSTALAVARPVDFVMLHEESKCSRLCFRIWHAAACREAIPAAAPAAICLPVMNAYAELCCPKWRSSLQSHWIISIHSHAGLWRTSSWNCAADWNGSYHYAHCVLIRTSSTVLVAVGTAKASSAPPTTERTPVSCFAVMWPRCRLLLKNPSLAGCHARWGAESQPSHSNEAVPSVAYVRPVNMCIRLSGRTA